MANLIFGRELSTYVTVGIALGQCKRENLQGVKSRFVVFSLKDKDAKGSDTVRKTYFEEDVPGVIDALQPYMYRKQADCPDEIKNNEKHPLYNAVNVQLARNSEDAKNDGILDGYFVWYGGGTETYKLRKGMCYANDADGNPTYNKAGERVIRDSIQIFTQIKYLIPKGDEFITKYVGGLDLESQGQQLENRFWKEAVPKMDADFTPEVTVGTGEGDDPFA